MKLSIFNQKEISERTALFLGLAIFILFFLFSLLLINLFIPKPKIKIQILGPEKAKAGEWVTYKVIVKNIGNINLVNPEIFFEWPKDSIPEKTKTENIKLGEFLLKKEEKIIELKGKLFGKEGEKKEVKTFLTFSRKDRKGVFISDIYTFSTILNEIPIDLSLNVPKKIPIFPDKDSSFSFSLKYISFLDAPIKNLKVKIVPPLNFSLQESLPPQDENKEWKIEELNNGQGGEIELIGFFPQRSTAIGEELEFKAQLFVLIGENEIFLKEISAKSNAFEPIISFSQKINGKENYIANPGEKLHYRISFKNLKNEPLTKLKITVTLLGPFFDLQTIDAPLGEFTPGDNSISWTDEKVKSLRYLLPGEEGEIQFWVKVKSDYKPKNLTETNAVLKNRISFADFEIEYRTKLQTKVIVYQEGYYNDKYGFFKNSGPHPPKVNETTSYTIVWKYENYYNLIENAKIVAIFPPETKVVGLKGNLQVEKEVVPPGGYSYPEIPPGFKFQKPLQEGMEAVEVKYLQIILSKEVPYAWPKNLKPTGYFGKTTVEAVNAFQLKYKDEILTPQNLTKPIGFVDERTRIKLNELLSKSISPGGGKIIWEIGKIPPGAGVFQSPPVAAFQITYTPGLNLKGQVGTLIYEATLSGIDNWTGNPIQVNDEPITTLLPDDPGGIQGEGIIH
jgi:uncharacterized repeat protein (TIGR01451 family)